MTIPTPPVLRLLAAALALTFIAAACGDSDTTTTAEAVQETSASAQADTSVDTAAGVEAAQWSDNVTITIGDGSFRYESDGLPSHELPDQFLVPADGNMPPFSEEEVESGQFQILDTADLIVESPIDADITLDPVYSDEVTLTSLGMIGVTISGAPLFNDYEDQTREFVAVDDNLGLDGVYFIDACNGHPLASGMSYHYHGVPYCVTDTIDLEGEHSTILGVLLDGFPIYGHHDENGETITSDDLDECSGHVGPTPEFPNGIYHYHLTEDRAPYSIDCYHGVIETSAAGGQGAPGGNPPAGDAQGGPAPDFSDAAATLGLSEDELLAALGQPPFDFDAAAATLGVDAAAIEAALPAPPGQGGARPDDPQADDTDTSDTSSAVDADELATRTDVALSAAWADDVDITVNGSTLVFASDGVPSHEVLDTYLGDGRDGKFVAGGVDAYDARFEIPLVPAMADTPTQTGNGAIGVAISGAVFFNPYEGNGTETVANNDNETIDGIPFIDACGGHPLPNGSTYHYHGIPFCITDAIDAPGEHSHIIGYLLDGYPIYGPQDVDGNEPTDLDACLGHTGPTPDFDGDTYHYHVISTANYITDCFAGAVR